VEPGGWTSGLSFLWSVLRSLASIKRQSTKSRGELFIGVESDGTSGSSFWIELPAVTINEQP